MCAVAARALLVGAALGAAAADRSDRAETAVLAADWKARHRRVEAAGALERAASRQARHRHAEAAASALERAASHQEPAPANGEAKAGTPAEARTEQKANATAGDTSAFPYAATADFLGDDSKGLVKETNAFAARVEGELTNKAGNSVVRSDEYASLLKQQDAGNDLVLATIHNFKTQLREDQQAKLQGVTSELSSDLAGEGSVAAAAGGAGAGLGEEQILSEEVKPSAKMVSAGVEDFNAAQIGLKAVAFQKGTGQLDADTESRIEKEFVQPLKASKERAKPGSKFLFCIFYSAMAGADTAKDGTAQQRGDTLEKIARLHAEEVLGSGNYKIGGKSEGYKSDRLGAIVWKVHEADKEGSCTPEDAQIAAEGTPV